MTPILTIFTAPKPFVDPHIINIQMNALRSWKALGKDISIILIGDEEGAEQAAANLELHYFPDVERNNLGTPLISSIFEIGRALNESPLLAYVNADILLFEDSLRTARKILDLEAKFLLVGQRYDLEIHTRINFDENWESRIKTECREQGKLHTRGGSDYFIYPRAVFMDVPDFAVGRAGWDNWMIYEARRNKWKTIDATPAIQVIHQNHDYSHLPAGQPHYRLPETYENVKLAGGKRTVFTLLDVDYEFRTGRVRRFPLDWKKFWREVEIFPLIILKSMFLAQIFFGIFHPQKAYQEFRKWLVAGK
jgi:hypothetical protein